jgi:pyrroline-5-carboxylate reductase
LKKAGVKVTSDNRQAIVDNDVIIVALKPYNVKEILEGLKDAFDSKKHIVISVVTGIFLKDLASIVDHGVPIFRAMPNTAIAIQESVTCLCQQGATSNQVEYVTDLFNQLGICISIDEKLMDAATVLGACGIAYALRFIRASTQGGIEIGFDARTANLIAAQTVKGAAELLLKLNRHPEEEIDKVTTPKGCTIVGLNEMEHQGFSSSLIKGIGASYDKIVK